MWMAASRCNLHGLRSTPIAPTNAGSFSVVAIDIYTVEGGKLVRADHVEDWATALRQLAART